MSVKNTEFALFWHCNYTREIKLYQRYEIMQVTPTTTGVQTAKKPIKNEKKDLTKKEYVLTILNALLEKWPLAKWLKTLVENWSLDDNTINSLVDIFKKVIKNVSNKFKTENLIKWLSTLEKMKQNEVMITQNEQENLDTLLSGI